MKKLAMTALVLVMLGSVFTGCGCMNSAAPTESTIVPPQYPTQSHYTENTFPATENTMTMPESTAMTEPSVTETTQPLTKESGRVKSHIDGNF